MARKKQLTKRQLAVIDDMLDGELDEQSVLANHKVSRSTYDRWLADDSFAEQFSRRIASAYRQSELIIARYAPLAAAKLVQLTESDGQETARKACLDVISFPRLAPQSFDHAQDRAPRALDRFIAGSGPGAEGPPELSEQTASRLLAALAEEQSLPQDNTND